MSAARGEPTTLLTGWGQAAPSVARTRRPTGPNEVEELWGPDRGPVAPRGLGRSYGDAAQCGGGTVADCTALDRLIAFDPAIPSVRVGAGCSLDTLMRIFVPRGYFVPVTPGTRFVTVGGAIAADVHGKNHHRVGGFGAQVGELTLSTPTGRFIVGPTSDPDLFHATTGGMGLTGVIEEAVLGLKPIETSKMLVDTERAADLDACLALLADGDEHYEYSVAWIDCLAGGARLGRAVLTRGHHARLSDLGDAPGTDPLAFNPRPPLSIPVRAPSGLLNPLTVALFNEAWFRRAPGRRVGEIQDLTSFFHPLDAVGSWNLLYGRRGFTQYQFVLPFGTEAVLRSVLERLSAARVASFLCVLKRFGPKGEGHLSFPMSGWTLALDLALGTAGLPELLDELDGLVSESGGRVYLAKDGRLRPELVATMYPRLEQWRAVRDRVDPEQRLGSDLARRLHLLR